MSSYRSGRIFITLCGENNPNEHIHLRGSSDNSDKITGFLFQNWRRLIKTHPARLGKFLWTESWAWFRFGMDFTTKRICFQISRFFIQRLPWNLGKSGWKQRRCSVSRCLDYIKSGKLRAFHSPWYNEVPACLIKCGNIGNHGWGMVLTGMKC